MKLRQLTAALLLVSTLLCSLCNGEIIYRHVRATSLLPGGRSWIWFPKGLWDSNPGHYKFEAPAVPQGWRWFFPLKTNDIGEWGRQWCAGIQAPLDAQPGDYPIDFRMPGESPIVFKVLPRLPERQLVRVTPENSREEIQTYLNNGSDIELGAGVYVWNYWLDLPHGSKIYSGGGAKVVRTASPVRENFYRVFHPLGTVSISGITLSHDETIQAEGYENITYIHAFRADLPPLYGPPGYTTVSDCVIERGSLIHINQTQCLIERCKFPRTGLGHLPPNSAVIDCEFVGRGFAGQHALLNNSSSDSFIASCRFDNTTRGIIFQNHYARHCMIADIDCHNIRGGESYGSNECLLFETPWGNTNPPFESMSNNLILDYRIEGCSGPGVSLYGDGIRGNKFVNLDIHVDGEALLLPSLSPGGVLGTNEWSNIEAVGRITLIGTHEPQKFENLTVIKQIPLRGNQGPWDYKSFPMNWPFDLKGYKSTNVDYEIRGFSRMVTPDAVLPLNTINPLEKTTTNGEEIIFIWFPIGWDYAENNIGEEVHCEYAIMAVDTADRSRTGSFSRRFRVARKEDGSKAKMNSAQNGSNWAPTNSGWVVRDTCPGDRVEIRVKGDPTSKIRWKLVNIKWFRM